MSQDGRFQLQCSACKALNYDSKRNKKIKHRIEANKHCKHCEEHTLHKETK